MRDGGLLEQLLFPLTVEAMPGNIPVVDRGRRLAPRDRRPAPRRATSRSRPASPRRSRPTTLVAQVAAPRVVTEGEEGEGDRGRRGRGRGRRGRRPRRRPRAGDGGGDGSSRCCGAERRGTPADLLVVGLGNPGDEYARTRHNVGAEVVELLATRHGATLKKGKERARADEVRIGGTRVALAIPLTYMNDSGLAVARARAPLRRRARADRDRARRARPARRARCKVKSAAGSPGHNGLRSIKSHLHSDEFLRVRIGVGKPVSKEHGADHVLKQVLASASGPRSTSRIEQAADAVECIVADGVDAAMNRFN